MQGGFLLKDVVSAENELISECRMVSWNRFWLLLFVSEPSLFPMTELSALCMESTLKTEESLGQDIDDF